jgi:hypothetical protein
MQARRKLVHVATAAYVRSRQTRTFFQLAVRIMDNDRNMSMLQRWIVIPMESPTLKGFMRNRTSKEESQAIDCC